jgi:pilus assembly protein CpaC
LDRRFQETVDRVPLLASVPLLGKIFQSRSSTRNNTELLVIVTPELVRPIPQGQPLPQIERPVPLTGNDVMPRTPGMTATGPVPVSSPTASMPVEKLLDSLKVQNEMKLTKGDTTGAVPQIMLATPVAAAPVAAPAATTPQAPPKD